jgi:3-deoxy-D-manno-octulosonate 8-phosphate phosphatase (KDO 8-P phosphatase)
MTTILSHALHQAARRIQLAVFDVDGVLTDGRIVLGPAGEEYKQFHVRDGHGLVMLRESGIPLAIISGRESPVVSHRMKELGVRYIFQGRRDKLAALAELCRASEVEPANICYVGDDLPDIPVLQAVGLPIAVADAHPAVIAVARYCTQALGGRGAVREVAELIMAAQGKLVDGGPESINSTPACQS